MYLHTMHTINGEMKLIYMNDFPNYVIREQVETNNVSYATQTHRPGIFTDFMGINPELTTIRHDILLDKRILINSYDMVKIRYATNQHANELIQNAEHKLILDDFKIMIAQKEPTFFLKDLSLKAIEELNVELVKNGMSGDVLGIQVQLSEWQKFFVVCSAMYMKFFFTKIIFAHMDGIEIRGKLVNFKPNMMAMARYENLIYPNELNTMRMYMPTEHKPNHKMNTIIRKPFGYDD